LDQASGEWHAVAGVVVVVNVATGAIVTTVGRAEGRDDPRLASRRAFVTGSTLKPIVVAAALDEGTVKPDTHFDCAARSYGQNVLHDASDHGSLSVAEILATSSNVGAARVYDTLGLPKLLAALHRFHLDDAPAMIPTITDGTGFDAAVLAAGELARTTPLQMASAYAAIFNDGVYLAPTPDGKPERVLRAETAREVTVMLEAALTSRIGHGKLALVDGLRIAGKTGTADLGGDHQYASFVGSVLNREPRLVVLVGLEASNKDALGPTAAAPMFARIVRRVFEPKNDPVIGSEKK
jgi:cell division protein FtsI (penicillin-binding protein 3)